MINGLSDETRMIRYVCKNRGYESYSFFIIKPGFLIFLSSKKINKCRKINKGVQMLMFKRLKKIFFEKMLFFVIKLRR